MQPVQVVVADVHTRALAYRFQKIEFDNLLGAVRG
jgi:hypothetical protein